MTEGVLRIKVNWVGWRVAPHPTSSPGAHLLYFAKIREQSAPRRSSSKNLLFIFFLTFVRESFEQLA
jgi:hypothetical protein